MSTTAAARNRRAAAAAATENGGRRGGEVVVVPRTGDLLGRHRLAAAISRLDQEIDSLQKELEELETMETSSVACKEVVFSTEGIPDALLPVTKGPENAAWDRWFQRIRSSRGHKWWAQKGSSFS